MKLPNRRWSALVLVLALVAAASFTSHPAGAGVDFKELPTGNFSSTVTWSSNPGTINNPFHSIVTLNTPVSLVMDNGLTMEAKIGNFNGYAYAQLRWISGDNGTYGGVSNVFLINGQTRPMSWPSWFDDGTKKTCVAGNQTQFGCVQLSDGSIWNQPQYNQPPQTGTSVIGAHFVVCYRVATNHESCKHWWLTAF